MVKIRFKNVSDGLKTSKELVKVLKRIGKLGDDHKTASNRLISALVCELDRARSSLKHLMSELDAEEEEKRMLIDKLREEAVVERKLRQRTEKMNRKLGRELEEAKVRERKMKEEMEKEKRARDVLEEVCDELARGIGEDKKDMEKEREMMRIADVLREERVQMKLMEAKFEFEEKHAAVERLKKELRRVLEGKGPSEIGQVLEIIDGSDDDEESDLKSIELNMESGSKWGYVESRRDHRTESRFVGSGEDDDPVEKRSVVVDNGERDESLKTLKEYIVSNMRFIGSSSSEQWNHRHLPSVEFVDNLRSKKPSRNIRKKSAEISSHHIQLNSSDPISLFGSERTILHERATVPQKKQLIEYKTTGTNSVKIRFKNVSDGLKTSKELVKVLKRIGKLGDDHKTASNRLISALVCELDRARSSLKHLMSELDAEEEERRSLIEKLREESVVERKLRQRTEKMNRKLGRELEEAKETERKTKEEMEREKRARDVLEEVCDELVRGIGEDKKDMEKEREMMRIADVLREERVQMKLMEAKFEFEEKHAAVERVKKELRRVLEGKGSSEIGRVLEIIDGSDDDEESDLKSIELNMESGSKWGYVESRRDHRTDSRYVGSGEDDDDPVEKRSVVVDNGERDESLKTLKEYIVSNMRFIGSSSSEQ
ncbi:hypothetical protein F2Q68_00000760 [Brassica cretica]|uniref:Uncharacterized protein n=1 Tax=Brassica cretica TaxID=69181 RepID=A0A8S9JI19_BRACR|nr:hypothetical protein F2Q68_00000760 [Brassica cretica]